MWDAGRLVGARDRGVDQVPDAFRLFCPRLKRVPSQSVARAFAHATRIATSAAASAIVAPVRARRAASST